MLTHHAFREEYLEWLRNALLSYLQPSTDGLSNNEICHRDIEKDHLPFVGSLFIFPDLGLDEAQALYDWTETLLTTILQNLTIQQSHYYCYEKELDHLRISFWKNEKYFHPHLQSYSHPEDSDSEDFIWD